MTEASCTAIGNAIPDTCNLIHKRMFRDQKELDVENARREQEAEVPLAITSGSRKKSRSGLSDYRTH